MCRIFWHMFPFNAKLLLILALFFLNIALIFILFSHHTCRELLKKTHTHFLLFSRKIKFGSCRKYYQKICQYWFFFHLPSLLLVPVIFYLWPKFNVHLYFFPPATLRLKKERGIAPLLSLSSLPLLLPTPPSSLLPVSPLPPCLSLAESYWSKRAN